MRNLKKGSLGCKVVQVVEYLLSMCESLSSNPSTAKGKKKVLYEVPSMWCLVIAKGNGVMVAEACNPRYSGGRDEDHILKPVWENSEILSRKYPTQKRVGGVAQVVGPEFKPQYCKKEKKRKEMTRCILVAWL
jgi:hypothetical protein